VVAAHTEAVHGGCIGDVDGRLLGSTAYAALAPERRLRRPRSGELGAPPVSARHMLVRGPDSAGAGAAPLHGPSPPRSRDGDDDGGRTAADSALSTGACPRDAREGHAHAQASGVPPRPPPLRAASAGLHERRKGLVLPPLFTGGGCADVPTACAIDTACLSAELTSPLRCVPTPPAIAHAQLRCGGRAAPSGASGGSSAHAQHVARGGGGLAQRGGGARGAGAAPVWVELPTGAWPSPQRVGGALPSPAVAMAGFARAASTAQWPPPGTPPRLVYAGSSKAQPAPPLGASERAEEWWRTRHGVCVALAVLSLFWVAAWEGARALTARGSFAHWVLQPHVTWLAVGVHVWAIGTLACVELLALSAGCLGGDALAEPVTPVRCSSTRARGGVTAGGEDASVIVIDDDDATPCPSSSPSYCLASRASGLSRTRGGAPRASPLRPAATELIRTPPVLTTESDLAGDAEAFELSDQAWHTAYAAPGPVRERREAVTHHEWH